MVSSITGLAIIVLAELLRTKKLISNEASRKTMHIIHGLVVASWAFIANYSFIIVAESLFLLVVLLARRFNIMKPLRSINRKSWGEMFFPLGVIVIALIAPSKWVFLAAMLHLGIADALAALVGRRFQKGKYYVFGQTKTIVGTGVFYAISLMIIFWLVHFNHTGYVAPNALFSLLFIPLVATLAENYSVYGSDNLSIPILVVCCLNVITR